MTINRKTEIELGDTLKRINDIEDLKDNFTEVFEDMRCNVDDDYGELWVKIIEIFDEELIELRGIMANIIYRLKK